MPDTDFIVDTELSQPSDGEFLGLDNPIHLPITATMLDILVTAKIFPSKSEARKNWRGPQEIPWGFTDFEIGKMKNRICIFKAATLEQVNSNPPFILNPSKQNAPKQIIEKPVAISLTPREQFIKDVRKIFSATWPNSNNFEDKFKEFIHDFNITKRVCECGWNGVGKHEIKRQECNTIFRLLGENK